MLMGLVDTRSGFAELTPVEENCAFIYGALKVLSQMLSDIHWIGGNCASLIAW